MVFTCCLHRRIKMDPYWAHRAPNTRPSTHRWNNDRLTPQNFELWPCDRSQVHRYISGHPHCGQKKRCHWATKPIYFSAFCTVLYKSYDVFQPRLIHFSYLTQISASCIIALAEVHAIVWAGPTEGQPELVLLSTRRRKVDGNWCITLSLCRII